MKPLYLVVQTSTKCLTVHSVHADRAVAEEWARCLSYDGEYQFQAADMPQEQVEELVTLSERQ